VLLITWGDQASAEPILRATVLGDIDAYVVKPGTPPDERFHRFVTEQLDEWGRSNLPGLETVRVVGEEWAARSHELREQLLLPPGTSSYRAELRGVQPSQGVMRAFSRKRYGAVPNDLSNGGGRLCDHAGYAQRARS